MTRQARRDHDALFRYLSIGGQGCGGHHFTLGTLQTILKAMVEVPLRHRRRFLEVGWGLGYVIAELRCMDLSVVAIELEAQARVLQDTMHEDGDVVLKPMDVRDLQLESFQRTGCTSITCFVGIGSVTDYVIDLFLGSPMAVELAYLVPADTTAKREDNLWREREVKTKDFRVTFAGAKGARRWVKLVRKTGFYIGRS